MATQHVAHFERLLGERLLHRTSRSLCLAEAGSVYLAHYREALDALAVSEAAVGERLGTRLGIISKTTAPVCGANRSVADVLAAYRRRCPDVVIDIRLENGQIDLVQGGCDLALRVAREPSPSRIVRPICCVPFHPVASVDGLARQPPIDSAAALAGRDAILPTCVELETLGLVGPAGATRMRLESVVTTDDTTLAYHALHAGIGIVLLPDWRVVDDLGRGSLSAVQPDHAPPAWQLIAAVTSRKYTTAKVRSFIDFPNRTSAPG